MNKYAIPKTELDERLHHLHMKMDGMPWETILIFNKINQYYYTGTMQDGVLVIKKDGTSILFVRKSYERAADESYFPVIKPMNSYRDVAAAIGQDCGATYADTETLTMGMYARLTKYLNIGEIKPLDKILSIVRSVKSSYELDILRHSGKLHNDFLMNVAPSLIKEGMNEAELVGDIYAALVRHGHHGVSRFGMYQCEMIVGQVAFGESSLYPTSFDGPAGNYGMSPAVSIIGSRERRLKKGDLVFLDIGFGVDGYHTDKTQVYSFGSAPMDEVACIHNKCMQIENQIAEMLTPGAIPADIYSSVLSGLDDGFAVNFMGYGNRIVKFLGHGVGLQVDEYPPIAKGFTEPLEENMVIAIEPKKGIDGIGMVGVEDTYIVTPMGGKCITGGGREIITI